MVLTHPHDDHVQGLIPILRDFQVDMVLDPALPHGSESYRRFLSLIKKKRIVYKRAVRGQVINFGDGVRAVVLHPPGERLMSVNDYCNENSVVLRVTYGMSSLLLAGDAGIEAENDILQAGVEVESDVLKVAHHGSRFATSERWLDYVKPKVAVISVGRNNPFGHPSDEVLARLTSRRIRVFRTDCNGAIMLRITKTRIAVQPTMPSPRRSSLAKEVLVSASVVSRLAKIRPTRCL
jgi:beta-lactamase superfamily II metal-dependent hydrolase